MPFQCYLLIIKEDLFKEQKSLSLEKKPEQMTNVLLYHKFGFYLKVSK